MKEPPPYSRADPDRACRGKIRWPTHSDAAEAARRQAADFGVPLEAYRCPHCGGWHTGNVPRWLALDREHDVYAEDSDWPHR